MVTTSLADTNDINVKTKTVKLISKHALPEEIKFILDFLSLNPKITFKSQQRNDPELLPAEKLQIALDIYERNPQTFLLRFGTYLEEQHLLDFARLSIAKSDEELHKMVKHYQVKLKNRRNEVKNRRFAALQNLIKEGEYFSEQEMMKRAPELYQELVGQYLSNEEKNLRDSYDVRNTCFSGILMHTMEQQEMCNIMTSIEQRIKDENDKDNLSEKSEEDNNEQTNTENVFFSNQEQDDKPPNYDHQWGNFDNENIPCSSLNRVNKKLCKKNASLSSNSLITAGERDLLKQEFIGIMYEHFLAGQDVDFDYASIDENTQYDDLQQIDRDKEEQYFNESDDEESEDKIDNSVLLQTAGNGSTSESEDELDIYMRHLGNHHSL